MAASAKREQCRIGFLTVIELPELGFVGGLLITNELGRPLEFQCTTPVKANRTQEILYGPTLQEFLYADLIGKTLLERATIRPSLVLAEQPEFLGLRGLLDVPLGVLRVEHDDAVSPDATSPNTQDPSHHSAQPASSPLDGQAEQTNGPQERGLSPACSNAALSPPGSSIAIAEAPPATIRVGRNRVITADEHSEDRKRIGECGQSIPDEADMSEPFERIREALRETLRAA